jgi:hypothetical protein
MTRQGSAVAVLALAAVTSPGCLHETTEATAGLALECTAIPPSGPAPLAVAFGLDVKNASGGLSFSISYGDGTQGSDPDARHVYSVAGEYVASVTATTGPQTARCSVPISVAPGPAPTPTPATENRWPEPSFRTAPPAVGSTITGKAPLTVLFNMCRSFDPDGDALHFRMDLDGNGTWELFGATGADCSHQATYAVGTWTATVCVTDLDCDVWPNCDDRPSLRLHPYQCMSYSVIATP